ncbi:radial spoke head 14 homolog [Cheilinus undulatus]|uniref:radial spoke head 14 homolog n=1 Tax=Cheilinus undulatus TaxID=241271 RepID=UPI001BD3638F|nr:radial spoke head 14 homolog [Cheilinus undulatus]
MTGVLVDRAPVAYGRWGIPQLFEELQRPETSIKNRVLNSLCDLMHDPDRIYQTVNGGFLGHLTVLLKDEDPQVRTKTCELLSVLSHHNIGRQALVSSSLLPPLSLLLDDSSSSCRRNVHRVLNNLTLPPAGAEALLFLVPKLMMKLRLEAEGEEQEEEEEVQVLLLSTLRSCFRLGPLSALTPDSIPLLRRKLTHQSSNIRREAAGAMMELSVSQDGAQQVCEEAVLPVLVELLQDKDMEVQGNAAGVIMYTAVITTGKQQCVELGVIPILLDLISKKPDEEEEEEEDEEKRQRRKAVIMFSLRALTCLAEIPGGRSLLLEHLPLLRERSKDEEEDPVIRQNAQTAISVITWTP